MLTMREIKGKDNAAAPLIYEYGLRLTLANMGYSFDPKELSPLKANIFGIIANEVKVQENLEAERRSKKGKKKDAR